MSALFSPSELPFRLNDRCGDIVALFRSARMADLGLRAALDASLGFYVIPFGLEDMDAVEFPFVLFWRPEFGRPFVLAAFGDVSLARSVFQRISKAEPAGRYTLQRGMQVIEKYPDNLVC